MRRLGRLAIVLGAVGVAACAGVTTLRVEPIRTTRATTTAPIGPMITVQPTSTVAVAPATVPARDVARALPKVSVPAPPIVHAAASDSAPEWDTFSGELGDGPFRVARASGSALPVAVRPDEPAATSLSNPLPSGAPRVVLVVGEQGDWLEVLLPFRPNGSVGWIRSSDVTLATTPYHGVVDRADHRLLVFDGTEVILDEAVAVGKPSTPTPSGVFATTELLQPPDGDDGPYGAYSFGLTGHNNVGQLGIHGTNEPWTIGSDASNGCVRTSNDAIRRLASFLPLGAPITVR